MSFIYKYTSLENAIKIIENESVILTNPKAFNDPFDSKLVIRKNEIDDAINLIKTIIVFMKNTLIIVKTELNVILILKKK